MRAHFLVFSVLSLCLFTNSLSAKDLVILFEGTWNNSIDYGGRQKALTQGSLFRLKKDSSSDLMTTRTGDLITPLPEHATNIARLFLLLEKNDAQRVAYIRGVGTDGKKDYLGGAFGVGASKRMEAANKFINDHWRDGDEICIFGFSRGAAIARRLARSEELRNKKIRFMGLFDTVAAFGIPDSELDPKRFEIRKRFRSFHDDLSIPDNVERVVHLVALDEDRMTFLPTLISTTEVNTSHRKEIWFSGGHGDIGGGWDDEPEVTYRRRQITLRYMLEQEHGLRLRKDWKCQSDVRVDSTWSDLGKNHAQEELGFLQSIGGRQKRVPVEQSANDYFAVPYRPSLDSAVVHPSARRILSE